MELFDFARHQLDKSVTYCFTAPNLPTGLADHSTKSAESEEPAPPIAIDLPTALAITAGQNPQVAFARQRIREAWSEVELAQVLWVPSLRAGFNYNKHEGRIQDVAGEIIETSRGSLYSGFGSQTVGAGSPGVPGLIMNFHLRDAIFEPAIAEQILRRRRHASQAVTNDMLLETATAYTDLLEALQIQAVAKDTLDHAEQLAKLTADFSETGQGLLADADRARAELAVRRVELSRADEGVRTARVRLVRLLSWPQPEPPEPQEPVLIPIDMVSREAELPELISLGLTNRPELSEARHLVGEAVQRLRREQYAPLVPSILLGLSYGVNGGGLGSDLIRFGDRLDMDAAAFWEIRQLGFGERAARAVAGSRLDQARWEQVRQMDQVAADVAEAHAQVMERHRQIEWSQEGITSAEHSYRRNQERIQDGQGLPLEALQAIQALDQARRQYVRSVADYNRSQFQLHRAVGWPAE